MVVEYNGRKKKGSFHSLPMRELYEKPKKAKESRNVELEDDEEDLLNEMDEEFDEDPNNDETEVKKAE